MELEDIRKLNPAGFARQDRVARLRRKVAALGSHIHAASYRLITLLRELEDLGGWDGWASPAHWLSWQCGFSLGTAREKFRVARALPELPRIREAFRKGELSFAQVRAMTRVATPANEPAVMMWATHSTASHMERLARLYKRYGDHAAALAQHRERSFTHWEEDGGMVSFRIRLPAEQAAVVLKAIESAKDTLDGEDLDTVAMRHVSAETHDAPAEGDVSAETPEMLEPWTPAPEDEDVSAETRRARQADAFVRIVESWFEPDRRPRSTAEKYQVHVHLDLRQGAAGPVDDPDSPALSRETLRRLGCEAGLLPVVHDGEEILSVGRKTRAVPPAIRRALRLRDHGCRFPGCTHTRHLHAHHIRHWADGGETKLSNLVELCGRHHRLLHEGGYSLRWADDGALVFTRASGERLPRAPNRPESSGRLERQHRHLHVSAETHPCHWDGARPDYGLMIELLDGYRRRSSGG